MKIDIFAKELKAPKINERELMRYAGLKGAFLTDALTETVKKYEDIFTYRVVYARLSVTVSGDKVDTGAFSVSSKTLSRALSGCDALYLVAATVGVALDRAVSALSLISTARAQLLDSFGTERVETLLDKLTAILEEENKEKLLPRVSAGYGDVPLGVQRDIFKLLQPERKIALYLSDSLLMTPMKSVTAFIGVKKDK